MPDRLGRGVWAHLIPHAGTMCLLDEVIDFDDVLIHALSHGHHDPANPLRAGQLLHAVNLAEYGAQSCAVHGALLASRRGDEAVRPGRLVSVRELVLHRQRIDDLAGAIHVHAERLYADDSGAQYAFHIEHESDPLARGRIAVIHPRG